MASGLYDSGREGIYDRTIDLTASTIKAVMIDTGAYTVNLATHVNYSDVPSGARIGAPIALTGKTYIGGVFDAADISFTGLVSPPTCEAILIFNDTGTPSTSRLIAYIDTGTGLPTPAGVNTINVAWSNGADRIFR